MTEHTTCHTCCHLHHHLPLLITTPLHQVLCVSCASHGVTVPPRLSHLLPPAPPPAPTHHHPAPPGYTLAAGMSSPIYHTKRIERPPGLSGYCPALWCAVCGGAASSKRPHCPCIVDACPNVCHITCLDTDAEFNCELTEGLRVKKGVIASVIFRTEDPPVSQPTAADDCEVIGESTKPPSQYQIAPPRSIEPSRDSENEDLDSLSVDDLRILVLTLRKDLYKTKCELSNYENLIRDLPQKRDTLVNALTIVDSLIATSNTQKREKKDISCSAIANRIDIGWENTVSTNEEWKKWWVEKAKPIKSLTKEVKENSASAGSQTVEIDLSEAQRLNILKNQSSRAATTNNVASASTNVTSATNIEASASTPLESQPAPRAQLVTNRTTRNVQQPSHNNLTHTNRGLRDQSRPVNTRHNLTSEDQKKRGWADSSQRVCEYCYGRYHTVRNCRERRADERHKDFINALRQFSTANQNVSPHPHYQFGYQPTQATQYHPQNLVYTNPHAHVGQPYQPRPTTSVNYHHGERTAQARPEHTHQYQQYSQAQPQPSHQASH